MAGEYNIEIWLRENKWKTDELFKDILYENDHKGFNDLCKSNNKVTEEYVDANWANTVASLKRTYTIGSKQNIAILKIENSEYYIRSSITYITMMESSGKFFPEQFLKDIDLGKGVFTISIFERRTDTEVFALEWFAKQHNAEKGRKYLNVTGTIEITSDLCPCSSCSKLFGDFTNMFPNVNLKIITSSKLHY